MEDPPRLKVASVEPSITYACTACGEKFEDIQSASALTSRFSNHIRHKHPPQGLALTEKSPLSDDE